MKEKIPELLNWDDEIVISDEISSLFDPEEIKELTMRKIHQGEKQKGKGPAAVILAAVLAAALAATAFASYRFMIAGQFDGYFGGLTPEQAEVMEQIGTGGMPASTANGTTLTPLAVIGDSFRCYAKFRLEAPEGTEFPADRLEFLHIFGPELYDRYSITDENGKNLPISSERLEWMDEMPGDNVLEFVARFDSDIDFPAHFNDGKSKILTINGIWLEEPDKEYTKMLDGPWSFDIGFYSMVDERTLEVDGLSVKRMFNNVEYEDEGVSVTLRSMRLSPLTLSYSYDFTVPDDWELPGIGTICIVMKDGSVVEVMKGVGSWTDSHMDEESILQVPIDLDEAAYIQFGSQQIQVN